MSNLKKEECKKAAGQKAAQLIRDGMIVGLGTGSTTAYFIETLSERCRQGLKIKAIASSEKSHAEAEKKGIPLLDPNEVTSIDLTVDGADEIDPKNRMIKGGGGALLREKIIAASSKEMVVIVDPSKLVPRLGTFPLPVEIAQFGYRMTLQLLHKLGYEGVLRQKDGRNFITDNNNFIYDIHFRNSLENPEEHHKKILDTPGVVETGFFFHLATKVIIGFEDGRVEIRS